MGTSNPFSGGNNRNPLVPDWVSGGPDPAPGGTGDGLDGQGPDEPVEGAPGDGDAPEENRFQSARTNFFKFAKAGGGGGARGDGNRNMRRAVGSFVSKASGGSQRAAQRMSSERNSTAALGRILSQAFETGIRETVHQLGLAQLAALPVTDIYAALVDIVCAPGGELDESFAREAYIKALAEIGSTQADLERPSRMTSVAFLAAFISNAIQNRILNAVGNKIVSVPADVVSIQNVEQQLYDYVKGSVDDAIAEVGEDFPLERIVKKIDDIYERSLDLLDDTQDPAARDEIDEASEDYGEVA